MFRFVNREIKAWFLLSLTLPQQQPGLLFKSCLFVGIAPDVNIVQAEEFTANGYTALDSGDEGEHGIDAFDCFEELWCDDAGAAGTADESFEDEELDDVFETPDDARVPRVHWGADIDWSTPIDLVDYDDFVNDEVAFQAMRTDGWELDPDKFPEDTNYPGLYTGEFGPTSSEDIQGEQPILRPIPQRPGQLHV
ncbi:hypothetical protein PF005_g982 [Phytophthora fragariae]|uniref:Uncharacterized protein n=1 Tax=Phytophthora fragariae TaxID=53985 RepID=A0A6A4AD24_9STRA|nr:hypothetical protein PF011_g4954 [Phytophthora fragariae]KAE9236618.1 hypothetical protein PF005_g982 [Phytophthora fragariae]KAE9252274.1 hypothetical protein PF002_g3899 [Phytophthora fragariae]